MIQLEKKHDNVLQAKISNTLKCGQVGDIKQNVKHCSVPYDIFLTNIKHDSCVNMSLHPEDLYITV